MVFQKMMMAASKFMPAMEADGAFERVMRLALVEANLGAALQIGIQNPVNHEQRALDATDFPQGCREFVLPWIGREFPQDLAWMSIGSQNSPLIGVQC